MSWTVVVLFNNIEVAEALMYGVVDGTTIELVSFMPVMLDSILDEGVIGTVELIWLLKFTVIVDGIGGAVAVDKLDILNTELVAVYSLDLFNEYSTVKEGITDEEGEL